jgi:hypothetical protein
MPEMHEQVLTPIPRKNPIARINGISAQIDRLLIPPI